MKFKHRVTGVILEANNEFTIGQLKKSADYEEVKSLQKEDPKKDEEKVVVEENKTEKKNKK